MTRECPVTYDGSQTKWRHQWRRDQKRDTFMQDIEFEIQNNEFVKLLLESIGDGIFVLDTHGRIIAWNPAMEKITGYSSKEIKG